jgi:8-hydroxy-5-deazaflavin:NADPH oxidoreductase
MDKERIAILGGTGELGFGLALRWCQAGCEVRIGSRDESRAEAAAKSVEGQIPNAAVAGFTNAAAAEGCTIAVLSVPFPAQAAILKSVRRALKSAILVDTTVPLAASVGGRATRMLGVWEGSAAQAAAAQVPGVSVVSAFHNLSASAVRDLGEALDCDILVCGDDAAAKARVSALVNAIQGLRALDAGGLEMARTVESITALLIALNRRYKTDHSGIRITGLRETG